MTSKPLSGVPTCLLGGVRVPDTEPVAQAVAYAREYNEPYLFNHVMRSWLFAASLAQLEGTAHDPEVLAIAAILHDLGLSYTFYGPLRFEVEGANAARDFAIDVGLDDRRTRLIWDAVALNSTPSLALHKEAEVALCTAGTLLDWSGQGAEKLTDDQKRAILEAFPRLEMKQRFTHAVCEIVKSRPHSTYDNFARDFGERFVAGYKAPSTVDYLLNAPFDEERTDILENSAMTRAASPSGCSENPLSERLMKIVVMGGTGLIGSKLVSRLREMGHQVVAVSPGSGVNTFTGEGLPEALAGASVVVDLTKSPWFEDAEALRVFGTSTRNLLSAETAAGVKHHVALSVVGTERLLESGYFRAKWTQEKLIKASPVPYTIVRSTQVFELIRRMAQGSAGGKSARVAAVSIQPIASDDLAAALADTAIGSPVNGILEVAGPDRFALDNLVPQALQAAGDTREVIPDGGARYFGALLCDETLIPDAPAVIGATHFQEWIQFSSDSDYEKRDKWREPSAE